MPRPQAPHGTYAAYRRHLREKSDVCEPCRGAQLAADRERAAKADEEAPTVPVSAPVPAPERDDALRTDRLGRLRWNLALVEAAMSEVDADKLAVLSKQHAALLAEIEPLEKSAEPAKDSFDEFFGAPNVVGITTAPSRMQA